MAAPDAVEERARAAWALGKDILTVLADGAGWRCWPIIGATARVASSRGLKRGEG